MSKLHDTIAIDAAVERVVAFLDTPGNVALLVPTVMRVVDVKRMAEWASSTFGIIYKSLGVTFEESVVVSRSRRHAALHPIVATKLVVHA